MSKRKPIARKMPTVRGPREQRRKGPPAITRRALLVAPLASLAKPITCDECGGDQVRAGGVCNDCGAQNQARMP